MHFFSMVRITRFACINESNPHYPKHGHLVEMFPGKSIMMDDRKKMPKRRINSVRNLSKKFNHILIGIWFFDLYYIKFDVFFFFSLQISLPLSVPFTLDIPFFSTFGLSDVSNIWILKGKQKLTAFNCIPYLISIRWN